MSVVVLVRIWQVNCQAPAKEMPE